MQDVVRRLKKNKIPEIVKQELIASIAEFSNGEEDYLELDEKVKNAKEPQDGIVLVKNMKTFWKELTKKIITIVGKQGKILKRFRVEDDFLDHVGLSRSNIYFIVKELNSHI